MAADRRLNCAVYTRKSSEEGLEQEFNSLDAQREACEAYVASQKHEGWRLLKDRYDDGGISGGTMERPGLQRLLADVAAGKVQIVVVYKVDRLTRALADFAKIIEVFDAQGASFVSVTQQFNTTTSMGRLTLNVLLSFAQFEREVTGERIRDKIAASKRKGMWMGGNPPLGYDCRDRKLEVVEAEAETVRHIFRRYAALGNVRTLKADLDAAGIVSKLWTSASGRRVGGKPFARGALYHLLQNRLYLGEIIHKGQTHPGQHAAIVDQSLWDEVQAKLAANRINRKRGTNTRDPSLLAGILFDEHGRRLTPSHANKGGRRYRYYVTDPRDDGRIPAIRLPAKEVENAVLSELRRYLESECIRQGRSLVGDSDCLSFLRSDVIKVVLGEAEIEVLLKAPNDSEEHSLCVPYTLRRRGVETKLVLDPDIHPRQSNPDPALIRGIAKAFMWNKRLMAGDPSSLRTLARAEGVSVRYIQKLLPLAYLSPSIVGVILEGHQPRDLTLEALVNSEVPVDWKSQATMFRFLHCF
ncbi:MAG: resolvase [Magnetovibrio sp.]|nr:resolvase [Magnetovibrio sp.]|tara:strand:- start:980 stop:2557 length:1578 start_codon:yes stop_codon:yes gene_type:complete